MPRITLDLPDPDTARAKLLEDLIAHNPNRPKTDNSINGRLEALEHHHREHWYLMLAVITDNLAGGHDMDDTDPTGGTAPTEDLPFIEDKESFVSYISMVTRLLKQGAISASEARAMLYGAQLTFAALREGGDNAKPLARTLP